MGTFKTGTVTKKWEANILATITSGEITEGQIGGLKRKLNWCDIDHNYYNELLEIHRPKVTKEQAAKGLAWLLNQWKTPKGNERKNNPFGSREETILDDFSHFELVGMYGDWNEYYGEYHNFSPVYRVIASNGDSFDYVYASWQSGQPLQIVA